MFNIINRDVLILKPKQALFNWAKETFQDELTDDGDLFAHDSSNVYLIPELGGFEESLEYIKNRYMDFMGFELDGWGAEEAEWPKNLSWEKFQEFFHISIQSMVYDTLEVPIEKDNYDDFISLN